MNQLETEKRTTQQNSIESDNSLSPEERLRLDVRESYLSSKNRPEDRERLKRLILSTPGFSVSETSRSTGESSLIIDWEEKESDFAHGAGLLLSIAELATTEDESFAEELRFNIADHLREHPDSWFAALNSEQIQVSAAHKGVTPLEHMLNVVDILKTSDYQTEVNFFPPQLGVFRRRVAAVLHDIFKVLIANGDVYQDHAEGGSILSEEFIEHCISRVELVQGESVRFVEKLAEALSVSEDELIMTMRQIPLLIKYHHFTELRDWNILTRSELTTLVKGKVDPTFFLDLTELCRADVASITAYSAFQASSNAARLDAFAEYLKNMHFSEISDDRYAAHLITPHQGIASAVKVIMKINEEVISQLPEEKQQRFLNLQKQDVDRLIEVCENIAKDCPTCAYELLRLIMTGLDRLHAQLMQMIVVLQKQPIVAAVD